MYYYMNTPQSFLDYHPLSNIELIEFFKINRFDNYHVLSRDEKHNDDIYLKNKGYIIFNLDSIENSGSHWVALYINKDSCIYFDPFGTDPFREVYDKVKKNGKRMLYTTNRQQNEKSLMCGYFCCAYLYFMKQGKELHDFLYHFGLEGEKHNDTLLKEIFEKSKVVKGGGFDIVEKINKAFPDTEFHLHDIKLEDGKLSTQKYSFLGPGTKIEQHISNFDDIMGISDFRQINEKFVQYNKEPINDVDRLASFHDLQYSWLEKNIKDDKTRLKLIHEADRILERDAFKLMKSKNTTLKEKVVSAFTGIIMSLKITTGLGIKKGDKFKALKLIQKYQNLLTEKQQSILASMLTEGR